jgi:hypothetical protein
MTHIDLSSAPRHAGRRTARVALRLSAAAAALAAVACNPDQALKVRDIDIVEPGTLTGKGALPTIVNSTLANFQIAYSGGADLTNGGHEGQINISGLLSDELLHAETFTDRQNIDMRNILPGNGSAKGVFLDLSQARAFADFGSRRFNEFDQGGAGHGEVLAVGAYTYVLFAENYCSGVPISTMNDDGSLTYGQPQTRDQLLQTAVAKFDSAITFATTNGEDDIANLARVGKGRALLDLGQFLAASQAVAQVPTSFSFAIESSTNSTRQNNGIWNYSINNGSFSVSDQEGGNGLPFISAGDPRVPTLDTEGTGFDGETPLIVQQKYPSLDSPVPLATGAEARLIEAEVALRAGDDATFLSKLNGLRAGEGLSPLALPTTAAARTDLLFQERGYWLFLTSHRLGDLRREVRQYGRSQDAVFPTGDYHKGGEYGSDVNLPVSADEKNNPNFQSCIDRNA